LKKNYLLLAAVYWVDKGLLLWRLFPAT